MDLGSDVKNTFNETVVKFMPGSENNTHRWNPLAEIRMFTDHDVADAQRIMSIIINNDIYYSGYDFLTALALHMIYDDEDGSLPGMANFLSGGWDNFRQICSHMQRATHDPSKKMNWVDSLGKPTQTHPLVMNVANVLLNKDEYQRSNVISSAISSLSLYADPIVALNTIVSDFSLRDLMTSGKPISLQCIVAFEDADRMERLKNLFHAQVSRYPVRHVACDIYSNF